MLKSLIVSTALVAAVAGAQAPGPIDPQSVLAGTYEVDPGHTQIAFGVSHLGISIYKGVFSGASGSLSIDPKRLAATTVDVSVPTASVNTTSEKLDEELRGAEWLDANRFPDMRFRSVKVTSTGASSADIAGLLTLHGVTRPLTLRAKFIGAGPNSISKRFNIGFHAEASLKRSDYGVETYLPMIGDEITISIEGAFQKPA